MFAFSLLFLLFRETTTFSVVHLPVTNYRFSSFKPAKCFWRRWRADVRADLRVMAIDFAGQTTYHKEQVKELKGLFLELVLTTLALDRVQKGGTQLARRFFNVMLLVIRITTILTLPCGVGLPWHFNYSHDRRIPRRRRCRMGREGRRGWRDVFCALRGIPCPPPE